LVLDLREVIGVPGLSVKFDYAPDLSEILGAQYLSVSNGHAAGTVRNDAGALSLSAEVTAEVLTQCSRCLAEFTWHLDENVSARLTESEEAVEDSELYYIGDAKADLDEILTTELLLNQNPFPVCKDDCQGLCPMCGADLNCGGCTCKPEIDPRLSALSALLDD